MPIKIKPTSQIKARLGIEPNGRIQKFFTNECAKAMDKYVPFDTGTLAGTVIRDGTPTRNVSANTITYSQKYAKYVYYGISKSGKPLHYQTDKHEKAGSYWDRRMVSADMPKVVKSVQNEINRGGKR